MAKVALLNPVSRPSEAHRSLPPPLESLAGKRVGILDSKGNWWSFRIVIDHLSRLLPERYGVSEIVVERDPVWKMDGFSDPKAEAIARETFDQMAEKVDCAIVGACF